MSEDASHKPLPKTAISPKGCHLLEAFNPPAVSAESAAILVMTDLARVPPATIEADATLEEANHSMVVRGVRMLLVVDEAHNSNHPPAKPGAFKL
ncbi:MAG: hypothetical protein WCK83_11140 [Burkholderiales bacterium]